MIDLLSPLLCTSSCQFFQMEVNQSTTFCVGGCPVNTVFNPADEKCDDPENVPQCKDYYKA